MSHSQGNDKIYEELRGYFPPEYDLTPDELEKEIELENKKREIALGMMRVQLRDGAEAEHSEKKIAKSSISAMHTDRAIPVPAKKEADTDPSVPVARTVLTKAEDYEDDIPEDTSAEEIIDIPEAEDVSDNELFAGYGPLNDLFDEMEDTSDSEDNRENERSRETVRWFFDFLEVFAICISCIIVVFALFFRLTKVSGESMEDTLYENEYLVVSDLFYEPKCGDIVVVQNTSLTNDLLKEPLVKRIIAVGGQSVDISANGMVMVTDKDGNSEILDQSFTKKEPYASISGHYDVPEGYVFVMGDNRNHSTDSRSPMVGYVDERCIFGKAYVRILPFNAFTVFENPYDEQER